MDKFVVEGQHALSGEISISGAKNAVLPIMAACLLWPDKYTLTNVPNLRDTRTMIELLRIIGAEITFEKNVITIDTANCNHAEAPYDLVKTMRASFYVLGPLLARFGKCKVSLPGGCAWGPRPVDFHIHAMARLGAKIDLEGGYILASGSLKGNAIDFDISSVGATGNALMAAVTAEGETVIENAAKEPEIAALARFLEKMGAEIDGIGTPRLRIVGQPVLKGVDEMIIPDRIEAGTFLIAGAMLADKLTIMNAEPQNLGIVISKMRDANVNVIIEENRIHVSRPERILPVDITTAPFPGFPTDLQAQWIAFMTQAEGSSVIRDDIYTDRFSHVSELVRLGSRIKIEQNAAVVFGPASLKGAPVMSTDIRASASLVLASMAAKGRSEISRVYHIDRGYESIEKKFVQLGAKITRVN